MASHTSSIWLRLTTLGRSLFAGRVRNAVTPQSSVRLAPPERCTGCTACKAICPRQAITMVEDDEGFLRPSMDTEMCVQCHACERVCPMLHPSPAAERQTCYAARSRDPEVLRTSASGGLFPEFAKPVLAAGGVVFGCVWEPGARRAMHVRAEHEADLRAMQGSKYLQSELRDTFREAKAELLKGRRVLFSGTPCQIAGLKAFLGKPFEHLLTVEIVCHSTPSPAVWQRFLASLPGTPATVCFREKDLGGTWHHEDFVVRDAEQNVLYRRPFYKTPFLRLFFAHLLSRPSCYRCSAKQGASGADLTIGDLWSAPTLVPSWVNGFGVSLLVVHTEQGARSLPSTIDLQPLPTEDALSGNPYYLRPTPCHPNRSWLMRHIFTSRNFARTAHRAIKGPWYLRPFCRPKPRNLQ